MKNCIYCLHLQIVLAVAKSKGWQCEATEIKAAFIQGRNIDLDEYVVPPAEDDMIWKLNKMAYGLDDATRNWYLSVKEELNKLGCKLGKH